MIRIHKPETPPEVLRVQGTQRCATHCASFDKNKDEYESGNKKFSFDGSIYGHATVRKALIAAQHGKCAFCERKIGEGGDVEHFRPKAASCQEETASLLRPGYYWLVYDWENLLLACTQCNQRHKGNLFPLVNPDKRALSHRDNIRDEEPLFLHPAIDDPTEHIGFREEVAFAVNGSVRGQMTIDALGLNRADLQEARLARLAILKTMDMIIQNQIFLPLTEENQSLVARAKQHMQLALQDIAEFAAMTRYAQHDHFHAPLL